jgi:hypothetical protein
MSVREIFIIGHGGWERVQTGPIPNKINVPEKCEVRLYTAHGTTLGSGMISYMLGDAALKCHDEDHEGRISAVEVFKSREAAPNMVLEPLRGTADADINAGKRGKVAFEKRGMKTSLFSLCPGPGQRIHLHSVFIKVKKHWKIAAADQLRFHWLCCEVEMGPAPAPPPRRALPPRDTGGFGTDFSDADLEAFFS